ncbi:MAG TPA: adenylate/guanylate cyclase domain-containing protein [Gaiella sp.]|nr:adenylate/guanylate cyclase domain-containing protein [Gaiella sp.]
MRSTLPTGTVTFLFTDIEGSTRLLHALGPDRYAAALAEHRRELRKAFGAHGGVEIDTQGDAFFVAFPTATGAAAAALAGQAALDSGPIRVRMGLHTGAPTVTEEGYVGVDVHRGARIAALAHGGQVLLSEATRALVETEVTDLGAHRVKDFDAAIRIYQLGREPFPTLRTPGAVELPVPTTPFLGREAELYGAVSTWLDRNPRLLTIVGPGGVGKTRFAIELARLLADEASGGTVFLSLAALRDATLVLPTLATRLGASSPGPRDLASTVGERRTHIVLDNVEQLLPAAAAPLAQLLAAAPALCVIATSREPLRISGEMELELPPVTDREATALFLDRAAAVGGDVRSDDAVGELCRRLDRLPLAIELAAARTKLLSTQQLLERLGQRLDLLRGTRDAAERHGTLRATIAWSHDLLDDDERQLFARLAVFRAGCTLERAERVCDARLDVLSSLLDKSLVRRRTGQLGEERFWMLETIRAFAEERLAALGDDEVRLRHTQEMIDLAREANLASDLPGGEQRFDVVFSELDDIRAALDWSERANPAMDAELVTLLEQLWVTAAREEGARRVERVLSHDEAIPTVLRARALRISGALLILGGALAQGEEQYRAALALFRELDDRPEQASLLTRFAVHAGNRGDEREVRRCIEEARAVLGPRSVPALDAQHVGAMASLAWAAGDAATAYELYEESAETAAGCGFALWETWMRFSQAETALVLGRLEDAARAAFAMLRLAERTGAQRMTLWALCVLSIVAHRRAELRRAGRLWGSVVAQEGRAPVISSDADFSTFTAALREETHPDFVEESAAGTDLDEVVAELLAGEPEVRGRQTEP